MSDPTSSGDPDTAAGPHTRGGDFALDIGDDLLAEALAAVEARTRKPRPATPEEMDAFAADLEVDAPEELADGEGLDDDLDDDAVVFEPADEVEDEGAPAPGGHDADDDDAPVDLDPEAALDLEAELADLQAALDAALDRADLLEERLSTDRAAAQAAFDAEREQVLSDKRKAMVLARRWKERAERAEARLEVARESRDAAAERAMKAEAAVQRAEERRDDDLSRAAERRRKELAEVRQAAPGKVLGELLPPIDNLTLAVGHAHEEPERVLEGLQMIVGQFDAALARLGVERIAAEPGMAFSPDQHEAFAAEEAEGVAPGAIVREVTAGYRLQGRLLRAARVIVAAAPAAPPVVGDAPAEGAPTEGDDHAEEAVLEAAQGAPTAPTPAPQPDADDTFDAAFQTDGAASDDASDAASGDDGAASDDASDDDDAASDDDDAPSPD